MENRPESRRQPASHMQAAMFFLHQLDPESPAGNVPAVLRYRGAIHEDKLRSALDRLTERHAMFRTTLHVDGHDVLLRIAAPEEVAGRGAGARLAILPESSAEAAAKAAHEFVMQPFDLSAGPLWHVGLFPCSRSSGYLAIVFHHSIFDEASSEIFGRELALLYENADPAAAGALPPCYSDFSRQQRATSASRLPALDHWTQQLSGYEALSLPYEPGLTDPGRVFAGERYLCELSGQGLGRVAAKQRSTPFMFLLSCFFVLMSRWTRRRDLAIVTPASIRPREFADTVGLFSNLVILRQSIDLRGLFTDLLAQTRCTVLDAVEYSAVPYDEIVGVLCPRRSNPTNPLTDVMFQVQRQDFEHSWRLEGVELVPDLHEWHAAVSTLSVTVHYRDSRLICDFTYDPSKLSRRTVESLAAAYQKIIDACVSDPVVQVGSFSLAGGLPAPVQFPVSPHATVSALIEAQARKTPERAAVETPGTRPLTYGDLWRAASEVSRALSPEIDGGVVAILLPRTSALVETVLGVWLAGGVVCLIDGRQPPERARELVEACHAQALITDELGLARLGDRVPDVKILDSETLRWSLGGPSGSGRARYARCAYIVFTSGTSGKPKPVLVGHAALLDHVQNKLTHIIRSAPQAPFRALGSAEAGFDVFFNQLLLALAFGNTLVLLGDDDRQDIRTVAGWNRDLARRVDVLDVTPGELALLVDSGLFANENKPVLVLFGGERAPDTLWRKLRSIQGCSFYSMYGPSEATIDCALADVRDTEDFVLGRSYGTSQVVIMEPDLDHPGPPGWVGEICIRGRLLAEGYITERGTVDRESGGFAGAAGFYRTGDLGRVREDGRIEFWGRTDQQVKISGVRIEPAEVQAAAAALDGVAEAACFGWKGRLLLFVVTEHEPPAGYASSVRSLLARRLPETHLPSWIVPVDAIPLDRNGKIDRDKLVRGLPTPAEEDRPLTGLEAVVADGFGQILEADSVGPSSNFFSLGGGSLLLLELLSWLERRELGHVPVWQALRDPSVAGIAAVLCGSGPEDPAREQDDSGTPSDVAIRSL